MKLVKQLKLYFQEGNSDKVYEIDLCESGGGYLVNFRYGRRGSNLKEGTKTIFPVELSEANKIFDALEREKRGKGYVSEGEALSSTPVLSKPKKSDQARHKAIIKILKEAVDGDYPENWSLSRIFWRVGELKINEALPYIVKLTDPNETFNVYSAIWTIGRCGTDKYLPFLKDLQGNKNFTPFVKSLLEEVLFKLSDTETRNSICQGLIESLPDSLKRSIQNGNYTEFEFQLRDLLFKVKTTSNEYLSGIYRLSHDLPVVKEVLLKVINDTPPSVHYFKHLRYIFKMAEMFEDYETYGIIAKNLEKYPATYNSYTDPIHKKERPFSIKTRAYLIRRNIRSLRRLGSTDSASYTKLASGILLAFNDKVDLKAPHVESRYVYNYNQQTRSYTSDWIQTHFDANSSYLALYYILYKNSPRYLQSKSAWECVPPYTPGTQAPKTREEAFPKLWDQSPEDNINLLSNSHSHQVQEFAIKVFKSNPDFSNYIKTDHIISFLKSPFQITQILGLEEARKKYDSASPDKKILIALLESQLEECNHQGQQWIADQSRLLFSDSEFITDLVKLRNENVSNWVIDSLKQGNISKDLSEIIIAKTLAFVLGKELDSDEDKRFISHIGNTLINAFEAYLDNIGFNIIQDLFLHKSPEVHALAGQILLAKKFNAEEIPEQLLNILLKSENQKARGIGISLLGKYSDAKLLANKTLLISFCLSPLQDVRNSVKPLISRLTASYPSFGKELIDLFVPAFLMKESYEGLHSDLLNLLSGELSESLSAINKEQTLLLLNSKFRSAQRLGALLLKNVREETLSINELVKLSENPIEDVRAYVQNHYRTHQKEIKDNKEEALRIVDSDWDDTRAFAFDYFRNSFATSDWTTRELVTLCDSTKEDVQNFGKEMITQCFRTEDGEEYLLKLSQHPDTRLQLFTSAYLEQYAGGRIDIIEKLKLYFITLLSQVNKGKVAKARAFDFLKKEALQNEAIAIIVVEILSRVSVSVAIKEKAECITALRDIQKKYPSITSPVKVHQYGEYVKK